MSESTAIVPRPRMPLSMDIYDFDNPHISELDRQIRRYSIIAILFSILFHALAVVFLIVTQIHSIQTIDDYDRPERPIIVQRREIPPPPPLQPKNDTPGIPSETPTQSNVGRILQAPPQLSTPKIPVETNISINQPRYSIPEVSISQDVIASLPSAPTPLESSPFIPSSEAIREALTSARAGITQEGDETLAAIARALGDDTNRALLGPSGTGLNSGVGTSTIPGFDEIRSSLSTQSSVPPGYAEPVTMTLPSDILFDFNSAELRPSAIPILEKAREILLRFPNALVDIHGHTDTFGTDEYNMTLSQLRADTVASWLRNALRNPNYKFRTKGFGKTQPKVNPRGSQQQQEPNRRVEILIYAELPKTPSQAQPSLIPTITTPNPTNPPNPPLPPTHSLITPATTPPTSDNSIPTAPAIPVGTPIPEDAENATPAPANKP
ncbi:MAG: OmpA family protein [Methylacidiphilales bacterium]|nr:OmpA family protein [Candidatus Methylacidiphilales bacterium]MDW8349036.1 OmpA family protein [Verrucomicrobiae bacterium]